MAETTNYQCAIEVREAIQQLGREVFEAARDLRHDLIECHDLRQRAALVAYEQLLVAMVDAGRLADGMDANLHREACATAWAMADEFVQTDECIQLQRAEEISPS